MKKKMLSLLILVLFFPMFVMAYENSNFMVQDGIRIVTGEEFDDGTGIKIADFFRLENDSHPIGTLMGYVCNYQYGDVYYNEEEILKGYYVIDEDGIIDAFSWGTSGNSGSYAFVTDCSFEFFDNDKLIYDIQIDNFAPTYEGELKSSYTSSTEGIESVNVTWAKDNLDVTGQTSLEGTYIANVEIVLEEGYLYNYMLAANGNNDATINGEDIRTLGGYWDIGKVYFTKTFTVEKELRVSIDNDLSFVVDDELTIDDQLQLRMKVNANAVLSSIKLYFWRPLAENSSQSYSLTYNEETGLYELNVPIDNNWPSGVYQIYYVSFYSSELKTSKIIYNRDNPHSLWGGQISDRNTPMSNMEFSVSGTNADITKPVIDASSLNISERQAVVGDRIKYSIKITDDGGIHDASLSLINEPTPGDYSFKHISLSYNEETRLYEGYLDVDSSLATGLWKIYKFSTTDENYNAANLYNSEQTSLTPNYAFSADTYGVYNYGSVPESTLLLDTITRSKEVVLQGESVSVSVDVSNPVDIDSVQFYYLLTDETDYRIFDADFTEVVTTDFNYGIPTYTRKYTATISFDQYGKNGKWVLSMVVIHDKKGGTTYYASGDYGELEAGDFYTLGLLEDNTSPLYNGAYFDKTSVHLGDTVQLRVEASDGESGVHKIFASVDGVEYRLQNNGEYFYYDFTFSDISLSGEHIVDHIVIYDNAGNMTEMYPVDLEYKFVPPIKIIAPSKFLEPTTSYDLKAVDMYTGEYLENVTWYSSDTRILSINSTTGVLSTKSREGEVTVTVHANDTTYATMKFIVTGGAIKVLQATYLGNASAVGYSRVDWEIEDESILMRTGRTTLKSINSSYWHSIEVIGLVEGSTRLKMLTPAGDILMNSMVYVYDPVESIQSSTTSLDMGKGDTQYIDYALTYRSGKTDNDGVFVSEDPNVVTVDQNGLVTAVGEGSTYISIMSEYYGTTLRIPVTVTVISNEITIDTDTVVLNEETQEHQIVYEVKPDDTSNKNVSFTSSNSNVATVSNTGLITAIRNGTATITITAEDGGSSATVNVTVSGIKRDINNLSFEDIPDTIYTGEEIKPTLVIQDEDGYYLVKDTDYTVEYSNNVNSGTGNVTVTGIGSYKGTKELTFNITKAEQSITYNSFDQTFNYDGEEHGIVIEYTGTIKYANENDEYVLDEMPKYVNAGEYTIKFMLTQDDNHEVVYSSNRVIINRLNIINNTQGVDVTYDGKMHTITLDIDVEDYDVFYSYEISSEEVLFGGGGIDPTTPSWYSSQLPEFSDPGVYIIYYKVTKDNYNDLYGTAHVRILGITNYNSSYVSLKDDKVIVKKYISNIDDLFNYLNISSKSYLLDVYDGEHSILRTGSVFSIYWQVVDQLKYKVVVLGDVNGDGDITPLDYVRIKNHIMETSIITDELQKMAADYNEDDQIKVKNYIMNGGN